MRKNNKKNITHLPIVHFTSKEVIMTSFFLSLYSFLMYPIDTLFPHTYKAKCGHQTELKGTLTKGDGKSAKIEHCFNGRYSLPLCLDCILEQGTNCARCQQLIMPGESVQQSSTGHVTCVNCLEMKHADCTGIWTKEGYREIPLEKLVTIEYYP